MNKPQMYIDQYLNDRDNPRVGKHGEAIPKYVDLAMDHIETLYPIIIYAEPALSDLPAGAIIGDYVCSVPGKMRFIIKREVEIARGVMPADLSRAWLRDVYTLPLKRTRAQQKHSFRAPQHTKLGKHGDCVYIDLKHAYLNILALGFDLEYELSRYLCAEPMPIPDEIRANKLSYAVAVSMSASGLAQLTVKGKDGNIFDHKPMNIYSNPCLFNLAQDVLNAIGGEMISVLKDHCLYVNTDGYIVHRKAERIAFDIIRSWGLEAAVKADGDTIVTGVGSYKIGDTRTRVIRKNQKNFTSRLMDRDQRRWLKSRFVLWMKGVHNGG